MRYSLDFIAVFTICACIIVAIVAYDVGQVSVAKDCDKLQTFYKGNKVYECKLKN